MVARGDAWWRVVARGGVWWRVVARVSVWWRVVACGGMVAMASARGLPIGDVTCGTPAQQEAQGELRGAAPEARELQPAALAAHAARPLDGRVVI